MSRKKDKYLRDMPTDIRIYINGALDSNGSNNPKTHSAGIFNNAADFMISGREDNTRFINGKLAHVLICNQGKSAAQIASWHASDILE